MPLSPNPLAAIGQLVALALLFTLVGLALSPRRRVRSWLVLAAARPGVAAWIAWVTGILCTLLVWSVF